MIGNDKKSQKITFNITSFTIYDKTCINKTFIVNLQEIGYSMSKIFIFILFCVFLRLSTSCGEDRTHEFEELTERDHWMTDIMKQYYLWGDSINEEKIQWKSFFSEPKSFFKTLTASAPVSDVWSWCSIDTLNEDHHERGFFNHVNSYGMDLLLMTDPTGATSRQYARVTAVIPGSPAYRCGIKRGDFIGYVDENKMSSSYISYLTSGKQRSLIVSRLGVDDEAGELVWVSADTLIMEKSEYVEDIPFPVYKHFTIGDNQVIYIMCNRLTKGPYEIPGSTQNYANYLDNMMLELNGTNSDNIIVDLRLCNYGEMDMANRFASYLLSSSFTDKVFATTFYNSKRSDENKIIYFNQEALQKGLNPENVFFITSSYTKGAAEWVIRAIQGMLGEANVFVIGTSTSGQYVMTEDITSVYNTTLHPAVAFVGNATGDYDYSKGITPDYEINEFTSVHLYPYGDENETVLSFILDEIPKL